MRPIPAEVLSQTILVIGQIVRGKHPGELGLWCGPGLSLAVNEPEPLSVIVDTAEAALA